MSNTEDRQKAHDVICDAFALAYGTDGEPSIEYWTVGADLAVTMLVGAGWLPPNADGQERSEGECGEAHGESYIPCCAHCGCEGDERIGHDDTCKHGCNDAMKERKVSLTTSSTWPTCPIHGTLLTQWWSTAWGKNAKPEWQCAACRLVADSGTNIRPGQEAAE